MRASGIATCACGRRISLNKEKCAACAGLKVGVERLGQERRPDVVRSGRHVAKSQRG